MLQVARDTLNLKPVEIAPTLDIGACSHSYAVRAGDQPAGSYEFVQFSDSFSALVGCFEMPTPLGVAASEKGWVQLHYRIRGEAQLDSVSESPVVVGESSVMLRVPKNDGPQGWVYRGEQQCFLSLMVHPGFIREVLRSTQAASSARSSFESVFAGKHEFTRMQLSAVLMRTVLDLIESPYDGTLRHMHRQAKALEVLCLSFEELQRLNKAQQPTVMLSPRDIMRLREVRTALLTNPTRWLTISQLSRQFALNQRKLKEGFKHLFGETVFQFAQEQRMIRARRMLEEDAMPIGQVSAEIGYDCHTSFTAAFKRHFGFLPREARLRSRVRNSSSVADSAAEARAAQDLGRVAHA